MAGVDFFVTDQVHVDCLGEFFGSVELCDCFGIALDLFSEPRLEVLPGDPSVFISGQEVFGGGKHAWSGDSNLDGICGEVLPLGDVAFFQHVIFKKRW